MHDVRPFCYGSASGCSRDMTEGPPLSVRALSRRKGAAAVYLAGQS